MWHHNKVLEQVVDMIGAAQNKAAASPSPHHKMASFIKEGKKPSLRTMISQHLSILNGVKDSKIAADMKGGEQYPKNHILLPTVPQTLCYGLSLWRW